jgi:hypothetical protein
LTAKGVIFRLYDGENKTWDENDIRFVLDQHTFFYFYSAQNSM